MVPSLAPGSQHERRRIESQPPPARAQAADRTALLRACLWATPPPTDAHGVWVWEREDEDERARAEIRCQDVRYDPVVQLMARARRHEPAGSRLFRGMTRDGIGGGGEHHGGVVQHCIDIAHGSSYAARGTSLTKEPVVAAAYGHQQHVACVRRDDLDVLKLHDFASVTGQA